MDQSGAQSADDNVDIPRRSWTGSRKDAEEVMLLTDRGIDRRRRASDGESEETPLLADGSTNGQAGGDNSRRQSAYRPWEEFADLPWWKKPHVSVLSLAMCVNERITVCRHIGS